MIIFTSDHGEEFLEHGQSGARQDRLPRTHPCASDDQASWRRSPSASGPLSPCSTSTPASSAFWGSMLPPHLEGRSLLPEALASQKGQGDKRPIFSETWRGSGWQSVTVGKRKLLVNRQNGKRELYDLASDPGETQGSKSQAADAELAIPRTRILDSWTRRDRQVYYSDAPKVELSEEERVRLEALGYGE